MRAKGDGGLIQRHDHPTCPPLIDGDRAGHRCQGRWVGTVDTVVDGRRRRKYVYARTQRAARVKLAEAIRARDAGTLVIGTTTLAQWLEKWLDRQARKLKPQTVRGYRSKARTYLVPHLGRHRLTSLRAAHIEAMYDALRDDGRQEATIRQTHAILGKALNDAERSGLIGTNPMKRVDPPGTGKNKRQQLDLGQARRVLAATDNPRWWLALFYGMRQGEVLGLRWSDIDLARHTLTVAQTLQTAEDGTLILDSPKSETSARVLPLWPLVEARLRLAWVAAGQPTGGLVFARDDGSPVRPRDDWQAWRDLLDAASTPPLAPLPYVALHAARNSAASLMEAAGLPDRLAMQILGHSTVLMTHGYQTADAARMLSGFEAMGELLELD